MHRRTVKPSNAQNGLPVPSNATGKHGIVMSALWSVTTAPESEMTALTRAKPMVI